MIKLGSVMNYVMNYKEGNFYIKKGLEIVKKYGNEYWEGVGYLDYYTKNQTLAKEYWNKALNMISNSPSGVRDVPATFQVLYSIK